MNPEQRKAQRAQSLIRAKRDRMLLEHWCCTMISLRYTLRERWLVTQATTEYLDWLNSLPLVEGCVS